MCRVIAYYRVSTEGQGRSGLGLEAQRQAVATLCEGRGWEIIAEYTEIESGKGDDRPALKEAQRHAEVTGGVLVVAKLDRLSRSVSFLAQLQDSGARFLAADMPQANELTVQVMAMVAQAERKAIGKRTSEALQAAKERATWTKADGTPYKSGNRLGNPNGAAAFRRAGKGNKDAVVALKTGADDYAKKLQVTVEDIRGTGAVSLDAIAKELNARHIQTGRGGKWHASSVKNLLARLEAVA